jgi:hypothetical protein
MLIHDENGYHFKCDACGTVSADYPTIAYLESATNFGNTLYDEHPGWVNQRGQLQVVGDDAVLWSQYKFHQGPVDGSKHICNSCRGLFNL